MIAVHATLQDVTQSCEGLVYQLGTRDDTGTWLAMRDTSPMFCFEAETKDEVIAKADDAIRAYSRRSSGTEQPVGIGPTSV